MGCNCGKKKNNACGMTPEVVEIINEECPVLFHKVTISADRGDDSPESPVAPTNGQYRNALVVYEATNHKYIYSSDGIYTRVDNDAKMFDELLGRPKYNGEEMTHETDIPSVEQLRSDMEMADDALGDRIDDANASIAAEAEARDNADQSLSAQITSVSGDIEAEAEARRAADLGLSQDIIQEANTRSQNDTRIDAALAEEATTRGIQDATIMAELEQEIQDRQDAIDDVQAELNRDYINDLEMKANASSVTFIEDKINPVTGVTSQERDVIPTASSTTAGTISAAEFNSITDSQEKIEALLGGAVAITGLPANPTQAQLTTAWEQETGRDELINRASIYDVTNSKVWTYYTNVSSWEAASAGGSVTVSQFTNSSLGTIKGSTLDGNVSANADGTGSVAGWSTLVNTVAGKASQSDMSQARTDITNIQGDIITINTALSGKANIADVPTKTSELTNDTNYVSDSNYVHTDNNFTTVEKTNVANNTAAVSSMQPKVTKLDDTAVRLVADKTIPNNADLNTVQYLAVGNYVCSTTNVAQTLQNSPTNVAFRMEVYNANEISYNNETTKTWCYRWRKIVDLNGKIFYQNSNTDATANDWTFYPWHEIAQKDDIPTTYSALVPDTRIPANSDLNSVTYLYPGRYYIASYNDATTIAHVPVMAAMMIETLVPCSTTYGDESTDAWLIRVQRAQDGNGRVYYRYVNAGGTVGQYTYGEWKKLATTDEAGGDVRVGDVLSQPNDVAYVDTQNIIDGAVTAGKVDFSTMEPVVLYSTSSTSSAGTSQTLNWTELADDIDNYRFLIINFMSPQQNYTSGFRDNIIRVAGLKTGRTVGLQNFGWGSGAAAQFEWARLDTNSTGLTVSYAGVLRTGSSQGPNTAQTYTQQPVRIRAIYGIK